MTSADLLYPPTPHTMIEGARILGAELATCERCGVLRVREGGKPDTFIRRARDEDGRVLEVPPPCVSPRPFVAPW